MTLFDCIAGWREAQQRKHELDENFAEKNINELTNYEFLQELSDAIEVMKLNPVK
jgi:hypothetical protein